MVKEKVMKDWKKCPCCDWSKEATPNELLEHVVACDEADPPVKDQARQLLDARRQKREEAVVCCALRKKIHASLTLLSEEVCGVSDAELADVTTFETSAQGRTVVAFRFCPWCGVKWVLTGLVLEPPPAPEPA